MLFRKYQIVLFRDNVGECRKLQFRGWFFVVALLGFTGLVVSNVFLYQYFSRSVRAEQELIELRKVTQNQKEQLLSFATKVRSLEDDITRIQNFDAKLRVMINMDPAPVKSFTAVGGTSERDFAENYLPLHKNDLLARKMHAFLDQLETEARLEELSQREISEALMGNREMLASTPSIWPTEGWLSSKFGNRRSPFTGQREFHKGIDISAPQGTPIFATAKGRVTKAGHDGGYGKILVLEHGFGLKTIYAHMQKFAVNKGQEVERGELIGYVGNTGRSTGPHLHYEVRLNNVPVNPANYILN